MHGRLLPFIDQGNTYDNVDLSVAWDFQAAIDGLKIGTFACPSDPESGRMRDPGGGKVRLWPTNYGFNYGTWFVFDPATGKGGNGAFYPNSKLSFAALFRRHEQHHSHCRGQGMDSRITRNGGPSTIRRIPQHGRRGFRDQVAIGRAIEKGTRATRNGPTAASTTPASRSTMTPNSQLVPYTNADGEEVRLPTYNSWQEGKNGSSGSPSYAIITSRSFHTGTVNVGMLDGSVRSVSENIDLQTWRALGTRRGGETVEF